MKLKTIGLIVVALVVVAVILRRRAAASSSLGSEQAPPPPAPPPPPANLDRANLLPKGTPVDFTGAPYDPPLRDKTPGGA